MTSTAVVNRYGSALVDVVLSPGSDVKPADAVAQLRAFDGAVKESPALRNILASPAVSAQRKRAVIRRLADAISASRVVRNFLLVLSDHRRADALSEVIDAFDLLLDERLGAIAGSKVRLQFAIDPELIGGVTAKIGSTVYDGSVRGQLADLRARLSSN